MVLAIAAAALAVAPTTAVAAQDHDISTLVCDTTAFFDQAEDQAHDPDGAMTGLVAQQLKTVKYRKQTEYTNCTGDPAVTSGRGSGFVTFSGTCVSAEATANGSTDWFDTNGHKIDASGWTAELAMTTTGTGSDAVTAILTKGRATVGRYANHAAVAARVAVDGTSLNCIGPQPQPITSIDADGVHSIVGLY